MVWVTRDRSEVYVREAMSTLFVEWPIHYGGVVTFETVASVQDVYEVRAFRPISLNWLCDTVGLWPANFPSRARPAADG